MKITNEHLEYMRAGIDKLLAGKAKAKAVFYYEHGMFERSEDVKDLQKRFCFDLIRSAGLSMFICNELYNYLDDSHIYTALKRICPKVTRKY
jgi:hypothetical protein